MNSSAAISLIIFCWKKCVSFSTYIYSLKGKRLLWGSRHWNSVSVGELILFLLLSNIMTSAKARPNHMTSKFIFFLDKQRKAIFSRAMTLPYISIIVWLWYKQQNTCWWWPSSYANNELKRCSFLISHLFLFLYPCISRSFIPVLTGLETLFVAKSCHTCKDK